MAAKLTKELLIETSDCIDALWDATNFDIDAYEEVKKQIDKQLDKIRVEENLVRHFDEMGDNL